MLKRLQWGGLIASALLTQLSSFSQLRAEDWPPVTAEEQTLKDSPQTPGAPAILLRREVDSDDEKSIEKHFYRMKILTDEGKKYADVSLPYIKGVTSVDNIKARLVRPDGSVSALEPEVFEKTVAKSGRVKIASKTFTVPEAAVGAIIDYRYNLRWDRTRARTPEWVIQHELPTLHARFSFKPYSLFGVAWTAKRLPGGMVPAEGKDKVFRLAADNIPAFVREEYAPPESALKMRVEFFYFLRRIESTQQFWTDEAKAWSKGAEDFIGRRKGIAAAAAQITAGADSGEAKLRKIYDRVQAVRNLSWERERSDEEKKREKLKDNNNVEDVFERGYGYRTQINRLFVALARGAGFEAKAVRVSERDVQFFEMNLLDGGQLDGELAMVRLGDRDLYLDPGTPQCPYGLIYWPKQGVQAVQLGGEGGEWVVTPQPAAEDARIERRAEIELDGEGTLRGKIRISYQGQSALSRRLDSLDTDDAGRRKQIEDEIREWLPSAASFKLTGIAGWEGSAEPLVAEGEVEIADFGVSTGSRLLLPMNLFATGSQHPFAASRRVHPVYFSYPYERIDEVSLRLPASHEVDSLPEARKNETAFGIYELAMTAEEGKLIARRKFSIRGFVFPVDYYGALRNFFDGARTSDEQQAVLRAVEVANAQ